MKILVDENLAKSAAQVLRELGYAASHVSEVGLTTTEDWIIVQWAIENDHSIVTFDLDFTRIVALSKLAFPSVVSLRFGEISIPEFREIMILHLPTLEKQLKKGALVTIDSRGVRVQELPVSKK